MDEGERALRAARLLGELADVSGEGERLGALRREAAAFQPLDAVVELMLDLLSPPCDPAGLDDSFEVLDVVFSQLSRARAETHALRLLEGLTLLEKAERSRGSARAERFQRAVASALKTSREAAS